MRRLAPTCTGSHSTPSALSRLPSSLTLRHAHPVSVGLERLAERALQHLLKGTGHQVQLCGLFYAVSPSPLSENNRLWNLIERLAPTLGVCKGYQIDNVCTYHRQDQVSVRRRMNTRIAARHVRTIPCSWQLTTKSPVERSS